MKIAIDCGHGSATAGKRAPDGCREHWFNVKTAAYFAAEMDRHGVEYIKIGWNDSNSRDDADVPLSTRQKQIKAAGCEYSFSFHENAFGDGKSYNSAQGCETLISDKAPGDSRRLAECVQKYLQQGTPQKNRGVKTQSLAMCNCSVLGTKASVLLECGFMTNLNEEKLMETDAFCKECAQEAAQGFCEYLGIKYTPEGEKPQEKPQEKIQGYVVQKGDTLSAIGRKTGVAWKKIAELNGIKSPYTIRPGQVLRLK